MRLVLLSTTALAVLAVHGAAFASEADAPGAQVDQVVITATGKTQAQAATKSDTPLIETPQSVSVVTREEMDVRAVYTVTEALAYTAGVQAEAQGIDSRVDEFSVRGFGAAGFTSQVYVDNLRTPPGGQWTKPSFDPYALQQVEVVKGPASVLFGQTPPGGLVNLTTKRPTAAPRGEVLAQAASFTKLNTFQGQIAGDVSGALDGDGKYLGRLVAMYRDGETQIDETKIKRLYVGPSFTWNLGPATSLTLLGQYQRDEGGSTYQFLPMTGTLRPAAGGGHVGHDTFLGEPTFNTFDRDQTLLGYEFRHNVGERVSFRQNLRWTKLETTYESVISSGDTLADGRTLRRRAVRGTGQSEGLAVDTQMQARVDTGIVAHKVLVGLDFQHTQWDHLRLLAATVTPVDIFKPVYVGSTALRAALAPQNSFDTTNEQTGLYAQDEMSVGKLRIMVGGRQDWSKDDQLNRLNNRHTYTDADKFTGRAGALYLFDSGFAPYASWSQSFQPSTGTYFDGTPFKPTTGEQYEAGLKWQPPGRNIFITASAYELTQQNITTPDPNPAHVCGTGTCSVQTGEGRIRGFELEGKATLPFGLSVVATATKMDGEVTKSNTASERGKTLAAVPETMASLFLDYRFLGGSLRGLGLGGGLRYTGESFGDVANTLKIPDYTVGDVFVRYDLGEVNPRLAGLSVAVNARNLTNERYVATCTSVASCYYGSGRTLNARIQYRW